MLYFFIYHVLYHVTSFIIPFYSIEFQIPRFCSEEQLDHGHHGKVVDCLKANYKKITSKECKEVGCS